MCAKDISPGAKFTQGQWWFCRSRDGFSGTPDGSSGNPLLRRIEHCGCKGPTDRTLQIVLFMHKNKILRLCATTYGATVKKYFDMI